MTSLAPRSRALVRAALSAEAPTAAVRARVRARVMASVASAGAAATLIDAAAGKAGAATIATTGAVAAANTGAAGPGTWGLLKAIVMGSVSGLFVVGAAELAAPPPAPAGPPPMPVAVATVEPGTVPVALPSTPPAAPRPRETSPPVPSSRPGVAPGLRDELTLLGDARQAIQSGDTDRALALLAVHERRYSAGAMREERLASRAIALCDAPGREVDARRAAAQFFAGTTASQLAGRVRAACARVSDGGRREK